MKSKQELRGLAVPLKADSVESPIVHYGEPLTAIHFLTADERWGRVTFEKLDSIRVCRGEYAPFPSVRDEETQFHWVSVVSNSEWLQERYEYEKRHYASSYNFGGDVDEMLREFSHYVFQFHDAFVEALAAGIWFESAAEMMLRTPLEPNHPLLGLKSAPASERFEAHGITCQVRRSPFTEDELEERARLCSQPVMEIGAELDGKVGTAWTLTRRVRDGRAKSFFRGHFGNPVQTFIEIPPLSALRPRVDKWLAEVRQRRGDMGEM